MRKAEKRVIPEWFDYAAVSGLSTRDEADAGAGAAADAGAGEPDCGVTPAAVSLMHVYIEIQGRERVA